MRPEDLSPSVAKVITYVKNVVTGRLLHWVTTHNPVLNELWRRIDTLPHPGRERLQSFFVSSGIILETLLLDQEWRGLGVHCDLKSVGRDKFRQLYDVLLAAFVFVFCETHTRQREETRRALLSVSNNGSFVERFLTSLRESGAVNPAAFDPSKTPVERLEENRKQLGIDFFKVGFTAWDKIGEILGLGENVMLGARIAFSGLFANLYLSRNAARE